MQSVDPNLLVFVEGVNYALNLSGVASLPVTLTDSGHVVYEAHDYGFDHSGVTGYDGYVAQIQSDWGYLVGRVPLWVGELVDEYGYWGGGNQQFVISQDAAGSFTISSINSLDPVEVPGQSTTAGTTLDQWQANGGTNQEWTFVPAG